MYLFDYFMGMNVLAAYMYIACCQRRPEEGLGSPVTEVTDEPPCEC